MPLDLKTSTVALNAYQLTFVQELQTAGIEFLVIGGRAMQAYGIERQTRDLDLFVSRFGENPERLHALIMTHIDDPTMTGRQSGFGSRISW